MTFKFTQENLEKSKEIISHYPEGKKASAVMPLLDLAQRQNNGWISKEIMEYIADMLDMPYIRLYEVASFYAMFNLEPVGEKVINVCTTAGCGLLGGNEILNELNEKLDSEKYTIRECECLGACVSAPVVQIGDEYCENATVENITEKLSQRKSKKS